MKDTAEINAEISKTLNHLTEICIDGEKGFQEAGEGLMDVELAATCLQYSTQRRQFARELQDEVRQLGGEPVYSGTLAGALHRGWLNIKNAVLSKDDEAIIAECERGEDAAKEAYEEALNDYLPPAITGVIQRQYQGVVDAHDRFSALKKSVR